MTSRASAFAAAMLVLAACSGGDDASPSSTIALVVATSAPTIPSTSVASAAGDYFAKLSVGASQAASPGSDAERYAAHRAAVAEVLVLPAETSVSSLPEGVEVCSSECVLFDEIVADPATGAVETFSVDGEPIAGRIVGPGPAQTIDGVTASIVSAYRNPDALAVVVAVDNASAAEVELFGFASAWLAVGADDAVEATGAWGSDPVAPGASDRFLVTFEPVDPVGELVVTGVRSDAIDVELTLTVG